MWDDWFYPHNQPSMTIIEDDDEGELVDTGKKDPDGNSIVVRVPVKQSFIGFISPDTFDEIKGVKKQEAEEEARADDEAEAVQFIEEVVNRLLAEREKPSRPAKPKKKTQGPRKK